MAVPVILANPNQVYSSIKGNIDAAARFETAKLSGQEIRASMISNGKKSGTPTFLTEA
ncbi:hypothetical protein [Aeromonas enteropelogenes]|uniref:endonuclease toxin domain-containing protein n=1 Tax=Aeromonas enteropelogenes TaxID=29489 RepID=UPI003BA24B83